MKYSSTSDNTNLSTARHTATRDKLTYKWMEHRMFARQQQSCECLKTKRPQQVYNGLITNKPLDRASQNSRTTWNKKAADDRSNKTANGRSVCHNITDDQQMMLGMLQSDQFVRGVICKKHKVSSIILYTDRQIDVVKEFCFNRREGSVLGLDKTYNLSSMYVMPSVYKNVASLRTNDTP